MLVCLICFCAKCSHCLVWTQSGLNSWLVIVNWLNWGGSGISGSVLNRLSHYHVCDGSEEVSVFVYTLTDRGKLTRGELGLPWLL